METRMSEWSLGLGVSLGVGGGKVNMGVLGFL